MLQRPTIERPVDGSWRVLFWCWWSSAPTCPGRSVKIRIIDFLCVHEHRPALAVWCVHEQRPTGRICLPDRPTERQGYAQIPQARPTTAQKERGQCGARVARYLGPNTPAALRTGRGSPFRFLCSRFALCVDFVFTEARGYGWSLGFVGAVRTAAGDGGSQENPFVMNGARRGAPGAGAFGAFRPPPPPGSQFTPRRFFHTNIARRSKKQPIGT